MKKLLAVFALILSAVVTLTASEPDFAHPQTTLSNAQKNYNAAISNPGKSGVALVKSLLEMTAATASIDMDSLPSMLPKVDKAIAACPDGNIKSLIMMVKANIINDIYTKNRWKYDQAQTPDSPLPDDITEWNGRQFRTEINKLATQSFDMAASAPAEKLANFSSIINANRNTLYFNPTLCDFVAIKAIDLFQITDDTKSINNVTDRMVSLSRYESAPWFWWMVKKIEDRNDNRIRTYSQDNKNGLSAIDSLFLNHKNCEDAGYVLQYVNGGSDDIRRAPDWLLPSLRNFTLKYPGYILNNNLRNRISALTVSQITISAKDMVAPTTPFDVKINYDFVKNCGFSVYSISKKAFETRDTSVIARIKNISLATDASKFDCDTTLSISLPTAGYYKIVPTANFASEWKNSIYVECTPFIPTRVYTDDYNVFSIVDYNTGAPLPGVTITAKASFENFKHTFPASGHDGIVRFDNSVLKNKGGQIRRNIDYRLSYKGFSSDFSNSGYTYSGGIRVDFDANVFTDRQLYHPGDTVKWAAVVYESCGYEKPKLVIDEQVEIRFYDANNTKIGHITANTDDFGRIHGEFVIPDDGLTGTFKLLFGFTKGKNNNNGRTYHIIDKTITVSDFKLATFKLDNLTVERDRPQKGEVTLSGKAMTYSGMPVSGAKVEAEIWSASWMRWFSPSVELGTISAVTDSDGEFSFVVTDSIISQNSKGHFLAKIAVTSSSGETRQASRTFTTGKPYMIDYDRNVSDIAINTDTPYSLPVKIYDAEGKTVNDIALRWWLNNANDKSSEISTAAMSGTITSGEKNAIDLSSLKSGDYYLSVEPVDTTLADSQIKFTTLNLYSLKNNTMPSSSDIFVPMTEYSTDDNGEAEILFGTPGDKTYIYSVLGVMQQIISVNVDEYSAGFHRIKVKLPDNAKKGQLNVYTTLNGETTMAEINLTRPDRRKITLEGSSMRDRLTSGSSEQWRLKLTDFEGKPIAGTMVATMFNSALNSIMGYSMPSKFTLPSQDPQLYYITTWSYVRKGHLSSKFKNLPFISINQPDFNPSLSYYRLRSNRFMSSTTAMLGSRGSNGHILVTEDEAYDEAAVREYSSSVKKAIVGAVVAEDKRSNDIVREEGEEFELPAETGETIEPHEESDFEYRASEVLQAFWMPELLIDDNGETEIAFTVPNANTTWSFNAFAWTKDLRATTMIREFVTSKPVMVQPNLPRFLRVGDKARVLASVFNNSDSIATVASVIELFDVSTGEVYSTSTSTDIIAASASATIAIDIKATGDVPVIGYRVRSTLGKFTDGEQAYIPVEAATSDVIESEVFYLNPGDSTYMTEIPKGKNMQSTLDYTDNPAWNIIKQLPGLADINASTSTSASRQLFGAATAAGMLKQYPALAEVLRSWSENPDSKSLTSRLSQNEQLKAAVLAETPWVQAAASDSHRMARLSLLFDKKATSGSIDKSIATLRKLQRQDGGWSWGEWNDKSSVWATNVVLQELGRLRSAGYMPSGKGIDAMADAAIGFYESKLDKDVKTDRALAYIMTMFPDHKLGLRGKQVVNATLQQIISDWKTGSTWDKAIDAIILNVSGYANVAKEIIGSLRQFAVASPSQGTSFPSVSNVNDYADLLYAFAKIEPAAPEIDGMRQWLIIREQTTEELGSYDPTRIIAAFAACGSNWLNNSKSETVISVNGSPLSIDSVETATGHIVTALPSNASGKSLSLSRGDATVPAYGAIISRYTTTSTDVKAASCPDLSVEKRITMLRNGKWQYADNVRLGEQVRVLLTIKAKRDLQYVTVIDGRPASFEPVDQLPGWVTSGGAAFYRENLDSESRLFIDYLPKGTYQITIDMTASIEGNFTSGIATVQSMLAPSITAHSAGNTIKCTAD